ncbi:ribonuclease T2 [Ramaria rubella]|nr:ribonuclease T2 [Ramaria rubella]
MVPALWSLSITNLSSKQPGVDFSDPKVAAALTQSDGSTVTSPTSSNQSPLRSSLGQGPLLKFQVSSSPRPARDDQCPQPPVLSCSAQAASTDACCVVTPGGILLHTQFWDTNVGQPNSWGIHGLWPDKCNGQFYENCDSSRAYSGAQIMQALQSANAQSTLDVMNEFWLSDDESPENFWAHEWKTHGTCVSTLEPSCFSNYQTTQEVAPYFETVVNLFQKFDTYQALSNADIIPSDSETYTLSSLQSAVLQSTGYIPDFVCSGSMLSSVQFYLRAQGPLQDGVFVQSNPSRRSSCPASGIEYPVKTVTQGDATGRQEGSREPHRHHEHSGHGHHEGGEAHHHHHEHSRYDE